MQCKWNVIWDGIQDMLDLQAIGIGCVTLAGATRVKPQKFGKSVRKSENENMMKPWWKLKGLNKSTTTAYTARENR
jgi:hypothetical protein